MFGSVRQPVGRPGPPDQSKPHPTRRPFPLWKLGQRIPARVYGNARPSGRFRLQPGSARHAPHPFCTGWSIGDVRLTTRYKDYLGAAIFGTLHEAGHGMYEQGSPEQWDLTPLAGGFRSASTKARAGRGRTSSGGAGRSGRAICPTSKRSSQPCPMLAWPSSIRRSTKVQPSLVRVEATRSPTTFTSWCGLKSSAPSLTGELAVRDLPDFWNAKYEEYLGVTPPDDAQGCLQDVHWSQGSVGYFPTYSMGNLLSYQIWECLVRDLGDVEGMMAGGNFAPILQWLQEKGVPRWPQVRAEGSDPESHGPTDDRRALPARDHAKVRRDLRTRASHRVSTWSPRARFF